MSREVATYGSGHIDCDARKAGNKKLRNHLFSNYGASVENRTSAASLRPEMICPNNCILAQSAVVVQPWAERCAGTLHPSTDRRNHHEGKKNCYSIHRACAGRSCPRSYADESTKSRIPISRLSNRVRAFANISPTSHTGSATDNEVQSSGKSNTK